MNCSSICRLESKEGALFSSGKFPCDLNCQSLLRPQSYKPQYVAKKKKRGKEKKIPLLSLCHLFYLKKKNLYGLDSF